MFSWKSSESGGFNWKIIYILPLQQTALATGEQQNPFGFNLVSGFALKDLKVNLQLTRKIKGDWYTRYLAQNTGVMAVFQKIKE